MLRTSSVDIKSVGDLAVNIDSFELHIRAENLSPATLVAYSGAAKQFHRYLVDQGMPSNVADIRREHVESFNGKLRDELLDREIFNTLKKVQVLTKQYEQTYNRIRPHSSLGYKPPAPEAALPPETAPVLAGLT